MKKCNLAGTLQSAFRGFCMPPIYIMQGSTPSGTRSLNAWYKQKQKRVKINGVTRMM